MNQAGHEDELTIGEMFRKAERRLPLGYEIALKFNASGANLSLVGPDDEEIDVCRDDMYDVGEIIDTLIDAAIAKAGDRKENQR